VQQEAIQLRKKMIEHHVSPRPVDDVFSAIVFENFLNFLDPKKLYFTEQEINDLNQYRDRIDDELNGNSWKTLDETSRKYKDALIRAEHLIKKNSALPFDFSVSEIYNKPTEWALDESTLGRRWYLHLKITTLNELISLAGDVQIVENKFLKEKENEARLEAQQESLRHIRRIREHATGYANHMASLFLRSVSTAFDPHSTHFTHAEMQNYVTSLSTEGFYFGITVDENEDGYLIISELTPGGPAWKSGDVHAGDVIEKVRWADRDWVHVGGMSVEEVNELLLQSNDQQMEFSLLGPGGVNKIVTLRKEKLETEENVVKSFILEGDKRIGYVSLPGFYSAWGNTESARCANDVAKEILKLKKEGIDGLVLDVRHNTGGSLYEAVEMAGIFIDAGPMGVLKDKTGTVVSVKDMNRGTIYDGPLVLLINGLSASASEFLAAALQDHNRAVIVGSSSYGKATGQRIVPMQPGKDEIDSSLDNKSGWGFSTITMMQIYRVTGKTAQQKGVIPDIVLPDLYDKVPFRESYAKGALPADSISKKIYFSALKLLPLKILKEKSVHRVQSSESFRLTEICSRQLVNLTARLDSVSLNFGEYKAAIDMEASIFRQLKEVDEKLLDVYKVNNHSFDKQRMQVDQHLRQVNEGWIKKLSHDATLAEAFYIICDYIATMSSE
jgi:carboxyl-terminal processing protease